MTAARKNSGLHFLSSVGFLFLLLLPAALLPRDAQPSSHSMVSGAALTRIADPAVENVAKPQEERESTVVLGELHSGDNRQRLAQTLPFQAPATPDIERQVRTATPTQGKGPKAEAPAQKDEKAATTDSQSLSQGEGTERRTVAPASSATKKKRVSVKPKASPGAEPALGAKGGQPPGFQPLSQVPLPGGVGSSSSLPPLPPAMPYTPPGGASGAGQRVAPATRDALAPASRPSAGLAKPAPSDGGLPSATPVGPGGSLDNFVLDSFRGGAAQGPAPGGQATEQKVPPSSLFGQLSQDMRQLGEGIKETFRSLLSLR
ncbi:MAG: hypothetical protein ACP5M0_10020 [Desulfomonilaceae bacterium]